MIREVSHIKKIVSSLKSERSNWEFHWQEIADYINPRKNDFTSKKTPGTKRNAQVLDNTGIQSNELLAGAMHGILSNPTQQFFGLTTGDEGLDDNIIVRTWLEDTAQRMLNGLNASNFQTEVHEYYLDLSSFGTGCLYIKEDNELDFVFQGVYLKEIYVKENHLGFIDEVYRVFEWDAKKIIGEFGEKNVPEEVLEAYKTNRDMKWEITHAVYPRDEISGKKRRGFRFPIVSQYVMCEKDYELEIGGYNEQPWVVGRWSKASGEVWGRGPGMVALPEVKMINLMQETMIKGAQKIIDPPVQVPDDGFVLPLRTRPGGVNVRRGGASAARDRITPIFNDTRIDFGFQVMQDHRNKIREAFYVDQFQMQQGGPQMTATEVLQRTDEKMRLLGPLLGRQQAEFLRPMIDRVFAIMLRKKRFLPIPEALRGRTIDVKYTSSIAKSQRVRDAEGIMQTVQVMQPFFQIDPTISDWLNTDEVIKGVSKVYSFPSKFLRDDEDVQQIRSNRAKQQEEMKKQQQQAQEAENFGKVGPAQAQVMQAQNQQKPEAEEV